MCIADAGIMICNASYKTTHVHEGKLSGYETSLRLHCIEVSRPGCPHELSHVQQHNPKLMLFFLPVYRSSRDKTETYTEVTDPTTKTTDVPVSLNEAYSLQEILTEDVTYD